MNEKIRKKIIWDDSGVSEILGDMLILAMTVVLFVSVFLFVWTMPTPDEDLYANFESSLQLTESGALIDITHLGGETLTGVYTVIYLFQNIDQEIRTLFTQGSDEDNPSYGIAGDPNWDSSEKWEYNYTGISSEDDVQISIVDTKSNRLIMNAQLIGKGFDAPPIIMERWSNPKPAINQSEVTISAKVVDTACKEDLASVYVNATKLNPELGNVEMLDLDDDCIFEADVLITRGPGEFELTIVAKDHAGQEDRTRLLLKVVEAAKPIFEFVTISPNSVEVGSDFTVRCVVVDLTGDLNLSDITVTPEQEFYNLGGTINTTFELKDEIPKGGIFESSGSSPNKDGEYELTLNATDYGGLDSTKQIELVVIKDDVGLGNGSYNDSIWAYIGPESLDFKKFYYTTDDPPDENTSYHLGVYIEEEHIGNDCYFHINIINHYYEDVYIDGNSKIRLLQVGGAASNKDIGIVQNGTEFGDSVGTTPDGTWYKIPKSESGDYFHGGDSISLVFGPFDLQSAKEGDVFGSIMVLTGSYGSESIEPEDRYGQTLPYQAMVIA
jgi:hypothetical protein